MIMMRYFTLAKLIILTLVIQLSCASSVADNDLPPINSDPNFNAYWYQGKAELTSYQLQQARYGEIREGQAVLIFVTEDFSRSKQVKLDDPVAAGSDVVKVMKLNMTKKFETGLYPYSMMSSVFTPVNGDASLKVTTSSQEWCGHTFTQFNKINRGYKVTAHSYFESEGEQQMSLANALLEDEVWARIRIAPEQLPLGTIDIIPGTMTQRLRHTGFVVEKAQASMKDEADGVSVYRLDYPKQDRTLSIQFTKTFPHEILGWEETYTDGWGAGAKKLTTKATRNRSLFTDYWTKNHNSDAHLKEELGL